MAVVDIINARVNGMGEGFWVGAELEYETTRCHKFGSILFEIVAPSQRDNSNGLLGQSPDDIWTPKLGRKKWLNRQRSEAYGIGPTQQGKPGRHWLGLTGVGRANAAKWHIMWARKDRLRAITEVW